jgi:hypothetical protein
MKEKGPPLPLAWLAFPCSYLAAYFLSTAIPTRLLWYYPLRHQFLWQVRPDGLAMDFYGRVLLSFFGGAVGFWIVHRLQSHFPSIARPEVVQGFLISLVSLLFFTGGLYVFLLLHRVPIAVPLPPDYVAR